MRYVAGKDEQGRPIEVADPLADVFARVTTANVGDGRALARALLSIQAVFGADLPDHGGFVETVSDALVALAEKGAARTVADAVAS